MPATLTIADAARRYGAIVLDGCTCGVDRFCPKSGLVSRSRPSKPVQPPPLIFLVLRAFWTDWTGRTGFEGEESPSTFYDSVALGVDNPSE